MENQFSRTISLIGQDNLDKLSKSSVAVFGLGGVGGYVVEALARSGVGKLILIDNDKVSLTNLNRQIFALHSTIGQLKTEVAKNRVLDINPKIEVETYSLFFNNETASQIDFDRIDYIVDAIDTVSAKLLLVEIANEKNINIISSMGAGNKLDPTRFEVSDIYKTSVCPLAKVMRHELKKRNIKKLKVVYSKELPVKFQEKGASRIPSSIAYVPSVAGLIIAGEVIKDLSNS